MGKLVTEVCLNGVVHAKAVHQLVQNGCCQGWLVGNKETNSVMSDDEDSLVTTIGVSNFIKAKVTETTVPRNAVGWYSSREFSTHIPSAFERAMQKRCPEGFVFCLLTSECRTEYEIQGTIDYNISFYSGQPLRTITMRISNLPCGSWEEYNQFASFRSSADPNRKGEADVCASSIDTYKVVISSIKSQVCQAIDSAVKKAVEDRPLHQAEQHLFQKRNLVKSTISRCQQQREAKLRNISLLKTKIESLRREQLDQINIDIMTLQNDTDTRMRITHEEELERVKLFSRYFNSDISSPNDQTRTAERRETSTAQDLLKFGNSPLKASPVVFNNNINDATLKSAAQQLPPESVPPAAFSTQSVASTNQRRPSGGYSSHSGFRSKPVERDSFEDLGADVERLKNDDRPRSRKNSTS
eukprot:TRINITY_DN2143_c0_g1_i1.p1 TRINITY_DN2143_c0_g1~~TRINITY_DN2143_c0_g1_i1.p1  ORF type:complete len:429 (+),score=84.92 TRINITY_DN2143_c0_g1_i1:51-1289(+)